MEAKLVSRTKNMTISSNIASKCMLKDLNLFYSFYTNSTKEKRLMNEETFVYQAENGNECEVVHTFAETRRLIVMRHFPIIISTE